MEDRDIKNQRTGLIVVSVLLILSVIGNVILLVRSNRLANEKDRALAQVEATTVQWQQQSEELKTMDSNLQQLRAERAELETELNAEIQRRDERLAQLNRNVAGMDRNRQGLIQENDSLQQLLTDLEANYQSTQNELEETRNQLKERRQVGEVQGDSISMARPLRAYNINTLTKWNRWLWADRYNVDRARRVDETYITFEVAGTIFSPQGTRVVTLVVKDPAGKVLMGNGQEFETHETGESMPYTRQKQIDFTSDPVTVDFVVDHEEKLESGDYQLEVYIDGRLARTSSMSLN